MGVVVKANLFQELPILALSQTPRGILAQHTVEEKEKGESIWKLLRNSYRQTD